MASIHIGKQYYTVVRKERRLLVMDKIVMVAGFETVTTE